jgi:hypothetical protein
VTARSVARVWPRGLLLRGECGQTIDATSVAVLTETLRQDYLLRLSLIGITIATVVIARWRTSPTHPDRSWRRIAEYA